MGGGGGLAEAVPVLVSCSQVFSRFPTGPIAFFWAIAVQGIVQELHVTVSTRISPLPLTETDESRGLSRVEVIDSPCPAAACVASCRTSCNVSGPRFFA
jgi:hypothetical protein